MTVSRVRARIVTSQPIGAYGGIKLSEQVVTKIAIELATGTLPMHFQHDVSRPVQVSNVEAGTERLPDGHLAAWAEFDVDTQVWDEFQAEVQAAGAPGGMSISITHPLSGEDFLEADPGLSVAADAHHFSEDEIRTARAALQRSHPDAAGELLYQFAFEPLATVVFDLTVAIANGLGPNIVASMIYDAAKAFFRPNRTNGIIFNIALKETRRGTRKLQVQIKAQSEEELRTAIAGLPRVLEAGASGVFTSSGGNPLAPNAPQVNDAPPATEDAGQPDS